MANTKVKVLIFVDNLGLLGHEVEDGQEVFALRDELMGLFDEFGVVGLFVFEFLVKLLLFFQFIGEILRTGHGFVRDFSEGLFEFLFGFLGINLGWLGFGLLGRD